MGKIVETTIKRFDGGIANDVREDNLTKYQVAKHFDALSYPHRLVPYRSTESGQDTITRGITDFLYVGGKLFGLGLDVGSIKVEIYYKNTFTDGSWTAHINGTSGANSLPVLGFFTHYKGFLFGVHSQTIFKFDITDAAAFVDTDAVGGGTTLSGAATSVSNGLVHSKDDILYFGYNYTTGGVSIPVIAKKNGVGTAWTDNALVLPSGYTLTSICEYGNYLAIACKPTASAGQEFSGTSKVFLWDRDSSVATLAESIDWGLGELNVIEELEGRLMGISMTKRAQSDNLLFNSVLSFKYYAGAQGATEFARVTGSSSTAITPISSLGLQKQKVNNRIYFAAILTTQEGTTSNEGIWSIGRSGPDRPFVVNVEYRSSDGTVPSTIEGFFLLGSYMFVSYNRTTFTAATTYSTTLSKTDDSETYSNESTYESLIFDAGDSSLAKQLQGITVTTLPLPSNGTVTVKYRKDSDTSWTQISSDSTDDSVSHSAINIESTGDSLPEYKEIQFQIISTGGAVITGFSFKSEITGKRIYD